MSRRQWMVLTSLAGLFLATYLTLYHYGIVGTLACNVGSCEYVQASKWAMFLGVPVAAWGVGFYVVMLALSVAGLRPAYAESPALAAVMLVAAALGVAFTAWLNSLEAFVIHAWCEWCLGSAALVLVLFVLCFVEWRAVRDDQAPAETAS